MMRIVMIVLAMTLVTACSKKREDLRSPCVGAENSPCSKRDVNAGWQA